MGILSKAKSKLKSVVNTAKNKVVNTAKAVVAKTNTAIKSSGGGSGGGGGGSYSAPKVNNAASVVQAKPTSSGGGSKITIPKVSGGPQSIVPTQSKVPVPKTSDPLSKYMPGAAYSYTPTPSSKKNESVNQLLNTINDLKSGKTKGTAKGGSLPPLSISELEKRGYISKTGDNTYKSTGVYEASAPSLRTTASDTNIDADFLNIASDEYSYGLGDLGGETAMSSFSAPSSSGGSSSSSTNKTGSGGGGSLGDPTSSRGSDAVSARDAALNRARQELERIQREVGNLTSKDESVAQDAVSSDSPEVQEEKDAMNQLKDVDLSPSRKALRLLDEEIKRNEQNLKDEMSSIGSSFDVSKTGMEGKQASETGQTSMAIANAGGYLGFTGSGQGVMLSLANSHRAELTALESERQQALQDARNAAANRRYDIVRLKAAEIARIDQETYERTKEYNAEVKKTAEANVEKQKKMKTQNDIFTAIQGGAKGAEDIFEALKGTVDIAEINSFLTGITKSASSIGAGFKLSATNTASLLGAGMAGDDVAALNEYVNENGYTDEVRNALSPAARAAADKIFKISSSTGGDLGKAMSILDLRRIKEDYGVQFPYGVTTGEVEQFIQDNYGADPEDMQDALDAIFGSSAKESTSKIDFSKSYLESNLSTAELKTLADKTGASSMWTGKKTDIARMFNTPEYVENLNNLVEEARAEGYDDDEILEYLTSE